MLQLVLLLLLLLLLQYWMQLLLATIAAASIQTHGSITHERGTFGCVSSDLFRATCRLLPSGSQWR